MLDAGRLIEFDEPHVLIQQPLGTFRKLVKQTGPQMARQLCNAAEDAYNRKHGVQTEYNKQSP